MALSQSLVSTAKVVVNALEEAAAVSNEQSRPITPRPAAPGNEQQFVGIPSTGVSLQDAQLEAAAIEGSRLGAGA
eukprot:1184291-Prorocentrum_minimum.AAC.2